MKKALRGYGEDIISPAFLYLKNYSVNLNGLAGGCSRQIGTGIPTRRDGGSNPSAGARMEILREEEPEDFYYRSGTEEMSGWLLSC